MKPAAWSALFLRHPYLFPLVLAAGLVAMRLVMMSGYMFSMKLDDGKEILLAPAAAPRASLTTVRIDGGPSPPTNRRALVQTVRAPPGRPGAGRRRLRCGGMRDRPPEVVHRRRTCPFRCRWPPAPTTGALFKETFGQADIARSELEVIRRPRCACIRSGDARRTAGVVR